jgi:hypothetical protein
MGASKKPVGSVNTWSWACGEVSVALCRPGNFTRLMREFPEIAKWERIHDEVFNVIVLVKPTTDPKAPADEQAAWYALLDEKVDVTSPVGRG